MRVVVMEGTMEKLMEKEMVIMEEVATKEGVSMESFHAVAEELMVEEVVKEVVTDKLVVREVMTDGDDRWKDDERGGDKQANSKRGGGSELSSDGVYIV